MTDQLDMFEATIARDVALRNVEAGAPLWVARIVDVIRSTTRGREFTTDDLWTVAAALGLKVGEPRAMGAALANAKRVGLIEPTGVYRKSSRKECHARPVLVWRRR